MLGHNTSHSLSWCIISFHFFFSTWLHHQSADSIATDTSSLCLLLVTLFLLLWSLCYSPTKLLYINHYNMLMSQSASSKSTTISCSSRKMNRCTTPPPTENVVAPPLPSTGSAVSNLYRCLQSTTDRIVQWSVDTLYPFISSTTVAPLMPVRSPLTIPVIANTTTGQIEQRIVSSERSTFVTGDNCQRDFEIMITEIKVEYQTVFGMRIWNKFLETKTIETTTSGVHLGMEPSFD